MKLIFVLPSMSRPKKFFETVDNITENCLSEDYEILAVLEATDRTMNEIWVLEKINNYPKLKAFYTNCTGKIDAINKALKFMPQKWDILILVADDIRFTMKGFDSFIEEHMTKYYPDLFGAIHYPEPAVHDRQITMPVLGRKLVEHFGYIYNPAYESLWCDTEMLFVLKNIMKKLTYKSDLFFTHLHPVWQLSEYDDLYRRNEAYYQSDKDIYFRRLANNFDL